MAVDTPLNTTHTDVTGAGGQTRRRGVIAMGMETHRMPVPRLTVCRATAGSGCCTALVVSGDLDADSVVELRLMTCEVMAQGGRHLVVDLSAVSTCDNASLYTLLGIWHALYTAGGGLTLTGSSPAVRAVLRHSRVAHLLPFANGGSGFVRGGRRRVGC